MPLYEFECINCGKSFEIFTLKKIKNQIKCPHCDSADVIRKLSSFSSKRMTSEYGSGCCGTTEPCDNPKRCCEERR
jgi:putative FmdB family regulatory protein